MLSGGDLFDAGTGRSGSRSGRLEVLERPDEPARVARVIPETVDSSQGLYLIGALILVIGIVAGLAGTLIKRRLDEAQRDERYVRERRGEAVEPAEPPRIAGLLQYAGIAISAVGIVIILAGWTLAPGQT